MSDKIIHTGSVEFEGVSDAVREELAGILQNSQLPVVFRIGDRKCMIVLLPPESQQELVSESTAEDPNALHQPKYGELRAALKKVASELKLVSGETVHSERVLWITNELRKRGLKVKSETVRTKLRNLGYYSETNM